MWELLFFIIAVLFAGYWKISHIIGKWILKVLFFSYSLSLVILIKSLVLSITISFLALRSAKALNKYLPLITYINFFEWRIGFAREHAFDFNFLIFDWGSACKFFSHLHHLRYSIVWGHTTIVLIFYQFLNLFLHIK